MMDKSCLLLDPPRYRGSHQRNCREEVEPAAATEAVPQKSELVHGVSQSGVIQFSLNAEAPTVLIWVSDVFALCRSTRIGYVVSHTDLATAALLPTCLSSNYKLYIKKHDSVGKRFSYSKNRGGRPIRSLVLP